MQKAFAALSLLLIGSLALPAEDAPAKPPLKIIPGQVIVPTDRMQRPWGELISLDLATRTGKFRRENNDEVVSFTVLPYAELLHHAAFGDLQDFRVGERAIFRLHENEKGEWVWLTYIQDEMNMMNGHKEYFYVDSIEANKGQLVCTQANFDQSFVREKGIHIEMAPDTRYWKKGQPAAFGDIKVGDKLRTKTHGAGKGKVRIAWEVFLDDESLLKFQAEQKAVHTQRLKEQGAPGYVDEANGAQLRMTIFQEGGELARPLKPGAKVRVAPAGVDRKPAREPVTATITEARMAGNLAKIGLTLDSVSGDFQPAAVARLWPAP